MHKLESIVKYIGKLFLPSLFYKARRRRVAVNFKEKSRIYAGIYAYCQMNFGNYKSLEFEAANIAKRALNKMGCDAIELDNILEEAESYPVYNELSNRAPEKACETIIDYMNQLGTPMSFHWRDRYGSEEVYYDNYE